MRLLLDTHIALWVIEDPARLGRRAHDVIAAADEISVSVVSLWEIAIKFALPEARRDAIGLSAADARTRFKEAGFDLLPVTPDHAVAVDGLPPLHGDPFDRLLVAQALAEAVHLVTHDARLADYGPFVTLV